MSMENIMRLWNDGVEEGVNRPKFSIVAKTASYTVKSSDFFTVFTTRGATGAVTFTLPTASSVNKGDLVIFINVADQNMLVAGTAAGLVVYNNAAATSIAYQTSSEKIAGAFLAISDGTSWIVLPIATETQTVTVA